MGSLAIPLTKKAPICHFKGFYEKLAAGRGNIFVAYGYGTVLNNGLFDEVTSSASPQGITIPTTDTVPIAWTEFATGEPYIHIPSNATHFLVRFNMDSFVGPASIFLDDLEFYEY